MAVAEAAIAQKVASGSPTASSQLGSERERRAPPRLSRIPVRFAPDGPDPSVARKLVSGSPSPTTPRPSWKPPAPKRRKRARGRLSQKLWPSPGKLFREARRASPQRQNNGARACDGAGLPWLSRKLRPSPGKLFREARRASSQRQNYGSERERRAPSEAVAEASAVAQKVFSGSPTGPTPASKRRERAFGQPDGPDPSPNLRRFFASRKMARDAPGPGFCEP